MLARVVRALDATPMVGRIVVCGLDPATAASRPELDRVLGGAAVSFIDAAPTPSASVAHAMERLADCFPLLVTTADHPLLGADLIADFGARATGSDADVVVALIEADRVRSAFPGIRRSFLRLRGGAYKGCNLFLFRTPESRRAPLRWMEVERHRKRPWRMVRALGLSPVLRLAARRLTLDDVVRLVSEKMGVRVEATLLDRPEAGFDVDDPSHLAAAERFLGARDD
jgi:2-phospho-L-lactate guanylyltransferase (CobY/MobA/RfbA family)